MPSGSKAKRAPRGRPIRAARELLVFSAPGGQGVRVGTRHTQERARRLLDFFSRLSRDPARAFER